MARMAKTARQGATRPPRPKTCTQRMLWTGSCPLWPQLQWRLPRSLLHLTRQLLCLRVPTAPKDGAKTGTQAGPPKVSALACARRPHRSNDHAKAAVWFVQRTGCLLWCMISRLLLMCMVCWQVSPAHALTLLIAQGLHRCMAVVQSSCRMGLVVGEPGLGASARL